MRSLILTIFGTLIVLAGLKAQPQLELDVLVENLSRPLSMAHAGDQRLFIVEKQGRIRLIDADGQLAPVPFLDITDRVRSGGSEQGLLGLAFHPEFGTNGFFYVNYTNSNGNTHVARFSVDPANGDRALPGSEKILLRVDQPFSNHNGGDMHFGPDGYLYISLGDGGSGNDPRDNGQTRTSFLGKLLRIDVDHGDPYAIPADNPFADDDFTLDEIWSLGLRNPWRFSFDRQTGDLWIADVGQNQWEEVNFEAAGSAGGHNYGWRCYEGPEPYLTDGCGDASQYTSPAYAYPHRSGGCGGSVTGGFVYRGKAFPMLEGRYLYGDFCTGKIFSLRPEPEGDGWINEELLTIGGGQIAAFGEDAEGEMYLIAIGQGTVYRLTEKCAGLPVPAITEANGLLSVPDTFQAYRWLLDGELLAGAAGPQWAIQSSGQYAAVLTNEDGCELFTAPVNVGITTVAMLPGLNRFELAPNPADGELFLNYETLLPLEVDLRIFDAQGRQWSTRRTTLEGAGNQPVEIGNLPAGMYLLQLSNGAGSSTRAFIVR